MPLADLVEDMDLYPRHAVDPSNVQALAHALEAGATLPPIIADKKSKRIVDGWHRARAYKRIHGPTTSVEVEVVAYKDEAAIKYDAILRNSQHGRRLDAIDRTRCVVMLRSSGFTDGQIAGALNVPEERVEKLAVKVAVGPKGSNANVPGTNQITLKRSVAHMEGKKLTKAQAVAHAKLPGTSFLLIARQLSLGLSEDMIDLEDERLTDQLRELRDLLVAKL
jgi:hypothetical protein